MKKIQTIIRIILTLALIYGVYTEAGIWTAVSLGLIFAGFEVITILINRIRAEIRVNGLFSNLFKGGN